MVDCHVRTCLNDLLVSTFFSLPGFSSFSLKGVISNAIERDLEVICIDPNPPFASLITGAEGSPSTATPTAASSLQLRAAKVPMRPADGSGRQLPVVRQGGSASEFVICRQLVLDPGHYTFPFAPSRKRQPLVELAPARARTYLLTQSPRALTQARMRSQSHAHTLMRTSTQCSKKTVLLSNYDFLASWPYLDECALIDLLCPMFTRLFPIIIPGVLFVNCPQKRVAEIRIFRQQNRRLCEQHSQTGVPQEFLYLIETELFFHLGFCRTQCAA